MGKCEGARTRYAAPSRGICSALASTLKGFYFLVSEHNDFSPKKQAYSCELLQKLSLLAIALVAACTAPAGWQSDQNSRILTKSVGFSTRIVVF